MIFVVCKYSNWCKFWMKELISHYRSNGVLINKISNHQTSIEADENTIRFIPNSKLETMLAGTHAQIIFWSGQNVKDLAAKIEKAKN